MAAAVMVPSFIYLGSPYTHPETSVQEERYFQTLRFTEKMLLAGASIFSPIVYGRSFEAAVGTDFGPWSFFNDVMVRAADKFWVLTLPGWEDSAGLAHEICLWERRMQLEPLPPPRYVSPVAK